MTILCGIVGKGHAVGRVLPAATEEEAGWNPPYPCHATISGHTPGAAHAGAAMDGCWQRRIMRVDGLARGRGSNLMPPQAWTCHLSAVKRWSPPAVEFRMANWD